MYYILYTIYIYYIYVLYTIYITYTLPITRTKIRSRPQYILERADCTSLVSEKALIYLVFEGRK